MYPRRKTKFYLQACHFLMATACLLLFELQLYTAVSDQVLQNTQQPPSSSHAYAVLFSYFVPC